MRCTLLLTVVTVTLGISACQSNEPEEKCRVNGGGVGNTSPIDLKADYAIGVGWIPFEETYDGVTWDRMNLREAPTTNASIAATIDSGTSLQIRGVSAASSLVMSRDEWIKYVIENTDMGEYERRSLKTFADRKMAWYRVKYDGKYVWAHSAFIETSDFDWIPKYKVIADHCWNEVYYFDKDGEIQRNEHDTDDKMRFRDNVVPFAAISAADVEEGGFLTRQYFGTKPGEPAYDLRRCTPRAFKLHRTSEMSKAVPSWFDTLNKAGVVVADYVETESGIWVADMAGAAVLLVDEKGGKLVECDTFALPLYLTADGVDGVWVADPYVGRIVRINGEGLPIAVIEDNATVSAISFNPVTRQLWVCGAEGEFLPYKLSIYNENGVLIKSLDITSDGVLKAVFEQGSDGGMVLFARCVGA